MRPHVRIQVTLAAGLLALVLAAPAGASVVTATNACLYSFSNEYRNQLVTLGGSVGRRSAPPPARSPTLSGASISATLPPSLPQQGYALGIFAPGFNGDPLAGLDRDRRHQRRARNAGLHAQRHDLDDDRGRRRGRLRLRNPDRRHDPDPRLAVDRHRRRPGRLLAGRGPGRCRRCPSAPPTPSCRSPAASSSSRSWGPCASCWTARRARRRPRFRASPPAPPSRSRRSSPTPRSRRSSRPLPKFPPRSKPSVASTRAKIAGGRAPVVIACTKGRSSCTGRLTLKSAAPVRVGGRTRVLLLAPGVNYSVPPGQRRTLKVRISAGARTLLRARRTMPKARATLLPAAGLIVKRNLTVAR